MPGWTPAQYGHPGRAFVLRRRPGSAIGRPLMSPARRPQLFPSRYREVPPGDVAFRLVPGAHLQHELARRFDLRVKPHALPPTDQAGGGAKQVSELQADGPVHREDEQPRTGSQREDGVVQEVGVVRDQHPLPTAMRGRILAGRPGGGRPPGPHLLCRSSCSA